MKDIDFLPIKGTDFVEFYVGNAKQAAYFYIAAFGFEPLAFAGLETGQRESTSYVVKQGKIRFIFTSSLVENSEIADHHKKHGDGVKYIALWVDDATSAYEETMKRGAKSSLEPQKLEDKDGEIIKSGIRTYGETEHIFIERKNYSGIFLPRFKKWTMYCSYPTTGLKYIDHMVGNVGWNEMNKYVKFYHDVMGFTQLASFDDKDISTQYTALMSKVMTNKNGRIKFPINEPAKGKRKSQIEEYLEFYNGPGVQHIALATDDIIQTVKDLKKRGIEFLKIPDTYYDSVSKRIGKIDEDISSLKELGILVDKDEEGYLLQIFTKPLQDRPTVFFEIIQRKGAKSFGKGNFKALFEAIEAEQKLRGNL